MICERVIQNRAFSELGRPVAIAAMFGPGGREPGDDMCFWSLDQRRLRYLNSTDVRMPLKDD
jgi:hypothetical protein